MSNAITNILITAKDSTAAAFASAEKNLNSLSSSALKVTGALGAIGIGAAGAGILAFTKQTIDAQDEIFKLSQKTGIAVESLAGLEFAAEQSGVELEKVASATRKFSLLVAEAADESGSAAKKLSQLGLSYKDLKDLSPEKQLLALAEALSKFSSEDKAVALTSLLGNKMSDLIPLLAGGSKNLQDLIEQGKKFNPVTEQSAAQSEKFNDQLNILSKSVSSLGREMVQDLIPALSRITDEMIKSTQESGILAGALAGVKTLYKEAFGDVKILGDVGNIRREIIKTQETISKLEAKKGSFFFDNNELLHQKDLLAGLQKDLEDAVVKSRDHFKATDKNTEGTKKFTVAVDDSDKKLKAATSAQTALTKAQNEALRINSEYIKLLQHERKLREDFLKPYKDESEAAQKKLITLRNEQAALQVSRDKQISLERAIEETTIARLEEKKAASKDSGVIEQLDKELAARRQMVQIIQSEDAYQAGDKIRKTEQQAYEQFSISTARNIQSNLANGISDGFRNGFKDGAKGLLDGLKNTAADIVAQVLSNKLLQMSGLGGSLGIFDTVGSSKGATNKAGNALSLAEMGTDIMSFFGGKGKGATGAASGSGKGLSSILGLVGGGSGAGAAGGMSTAGGALAIGGAYLGSIQLGSAIAGENKLLGMDGTTTALIGAALGGPFGAIVAGALNKIFGREEYKFRQQSLQGTISNSGFDGNFTDVYRSKGGLLSGNKHKSYNSELPVEIQDAFDSAIQGFSDSTLTAAKTLGLSTSFIDGYNKDIQIKSEKGQKITEEAINTLFDDLGNEFARGVLPTIDEFRKLGEDSAATLSRLTGEFNTLASGARFLGASTEYAQKLISDLSIGARTNLVEIFGGADQLIQSTSFFFDNFLTESERFNIISGDLKKSLQDLGLSADLTIEDFKALVQATGTSNELRASLLALGEDFLYVADATEQAGLAAQQIIDTLIAGAMNLGASNSYATQLISGMSKDAQESFVNLAGGANELLNNTSFFFQNILSESDRLAIASDNVNTVLSDLGLWTDLTVEQFEELVQSLETSPEMRAGLLGIVEDFFAVRSSADTASDSLDNFTKTAIGFSEDMMRADLEKRQGKINMLLNDADVTIGYLLDGVKKLADLSTSVKDATRDITPQSLEDARSNITSQLMYGKKGQLIGVSNNGAGIDRDSLSTLSNLSSSGFSSRTEYERAKGINLNILGLLDKALAAGIKTGNENIQNLQKERNKIPKLPSFDVGGIVPKTQVALVHRGERIINPQQNEALVHLLQQLIAAVESGAGISRDIYTTLKNVSTGNALRTA